MSGHNGDETFERWFREYHTRLLAQCRRIVGDAATAEDIAQETLLRAWLGRDRMREEDLGAWLTVVARNLCISHMRRQKKQIPTEILPETPDENADPAHVVARLESRRAVRRAMRGMGERHRVLLFKREIEGVDYEELSADLGLSAAGTRTVLFRARRVLKDRLAAAGEGLAAFIGGVRVRFRTWTSNAASSLEAAATPVLQIGMAVALSSGLASAPLSAAVIVSPNRIVKILTSPADVASNSFTAAPTSGSVARTDNVGAISQPPRRAGQPLKSDVGLDPEKNGASGDIEDAKGDRLIYFDYYWDPDAENLSPTDGRISYTVIDVVSRNACERLPQACHQEETSHE